MSTVKQPEALRLADLIDQSKAEISIADVWEAAAELRRLHEVNVELLEALKRCAYYISGPTAWSQQQEDSLVVDVHTAIAKATVGAA